MSDPMPPSQVILESFKRNNGIPSEVVVEQLSMQVLLPVDEVLMWLNNLKTVQDNRAKGRRKQRLRVKKRRLMKIQKETRKTFVIRAD